MAALHELGAAELAALYASGEASPVEAVAAVLAHIDRREPELNALWALDGQAALAQARASEARWRAGSPCSALDGVPGTIKDNILTAGIATPLGCAATPLVPAGEDAPPAARWREAGCVLLAKTTMPDWGMLSSGLSSFHKLARNPWDPRKTPGGSSAGAGTAAAAGYGPLHIGTDIGGSIRLPAGWCGLVGLKPSAGRVPIRPPYIGRVAGPMTRSVRDAALMMQILSKPDWRDATALPPQDIAWTGLQRDLKGLRLGLLLDAGWGLPVLPEVRACIAAAARAFEAAGAVVEPMAPLSTRDMIDGIDRFWRMRSWHDFRALTPEQQAQVLPYIREWIAPGEHTSAQALLQGFNQFAAQRDAAVAACQPFDYVLSPTAPVPAFDAELASPLHDPARPLEHIAFTMPFNMSEQPALSINAGFTAEGLPIGLQIAGRRHDDLGVLQMGAAWEQLRPAGAVRPWPMGSAA